MKQYYLKIISKNEKSLKTFLHFFFKHLKTKFNIIQKATSTQTSKKTITLLKSPHVNKVAQEHFEMRIFTEQLLVKSFYMKKNLVILKKNLNRLFQDISIHLEFVANKKIRNKDVFLVFYPDNFKLFFYKPYRSNNKRYKQKTALKKLFLKKNYLFNLTQFLNIISIFGEILTMSLKDNLKLSK